MKGPQGILGLSEELIISDSSQAIEKCQFQTWFDCPFLPGFLYTGRCFFPESFELSHG